MEINLKNLVLDMEKTLAGNKYVVEKPKVYDAFKEGVRVGPEGIAYTCLIEGFNFDKQTIKVAGSVQPAFEFEGTPVLVEFEGLDGKLWRDFNSKGELKLSVTAKSIRPCADKTRVKINAGGEKE